MNLNDFFSKPTRIKEAYANNYPSYTPPAAAADVSSDDTDSIDSTDSAGEPKFDRLGKTGREASIDFRNGFTPGDDETDYETENEPELGTFRMGKRVEPDDEATNAFMAALTPSQQDNRFTAPAGWRYVEKDEDPARYGSDTTISGTGTPDWRSIAAAGKPAAASGLPKMRFDRATNSLVPVDQPVALDLSPKNSNIKSGSNSNIDADTRARALAWAARKNAVGGIRAQDVGPDNSAPAVVKPVVVAAPAVVKPAVVPPAASLKDLPVEKPSSWKDIAQANNISNPNRILPGQVLKIPGRADYTVQPGDTLADIAAGKIKAPKYTPTASDTQPAAAAVLKKYPNVGTLAPIPREVMKDLGMDAQTKKEIAKNGREELLTPAIIQQQKKADADIAAIDKKMRDRAAAQANKKVKEDDINEQTVPNEFKWGAPSWTARDGTVLAYDKKTNAYNMSSGPTKPDPNTMMSGIQSQRTTMKNGQPVNAYDRTFIAMNPATGTGHYTRSSQEGDNEPTQIHRRDVPADELAKLRADAGIPPKADDVDEGTFDDQTQVSSIERDSTSDIDGKTNQSFSSTSFQQDPANPGNNSYMDRQDNNGVTSTTYAQNVTPKWMSNLKATAGLPGAKPAAQPPSQYPTQAGQGMNNKPFAAYSTPPGQMEINRESIDRMRFLAGIRKK